MRLQSVIAAAYVEVQSRFGFKPDVKRRVNALLRRPVEDDFRALAHFHLTPGHVIVDAGANRGETIAATRLFQPTAPIGAFEPNPLLAESQRARCASDGHVTIENSGLGRAAGQFDLFVPYYKGVPFDGLASFREEEAANWLNADRLAGFDSVHQTIRRFHCRVGTLDTFALRPGLIKIDVQGLEPDVIAGGLATIEADKPAVLMENNTPQTDAIDLFRLGYEAYAFEGGRLRRGKIGSLNTFYIHPDRRDAFDPSIYA